MNGCIITEVKGGWGGRAIYDSTFYNIVSRPETYNYVIDYAGPANKIHDTKTLISTAVICIWSIKRWYLVSVQENIETCWCMAIPVEKYMFSEERWVE